MLKSKLLDKHEMYEKMELSEEDLLSYNDPESEYFDPIFPKPFSRNNNLFWDINEIRRWRKILPDLLALEDHGFIKFLDKP